MRLISDYLDGDFTIVDLSKRYSVSRPTVYQWIGRYRSEGAEGLNEKSRAPHHCTHRTSQEVVSAIVALRRRYRVGAQEAPQGSRWTFSRTSAAVPNDVLQDSQASRPGPEEASQTLGGAPREPGEGCDGTEPGTVRGLQRAVQNTRWALLLPPDGHGQLLTLSDRMSGACIYQNR